MRAVVLALLAAKCSGFACFGPQSEVLHDAIDEIIVEQQLIQGGAGGSEVTTTWHDDETVEDVVHFFISVIGADDGSLLVAVLSPTDDELRRALLTRSRGPETAWRIVAMTLEDIQRCISILLEYVSRQGVSSVDVCNTDLYWTMTSEEWLVKDTEPKPAVGSLHDDIAELKQLLDEPGRASSVDLDRLASLLRLLSLQLTYPASGATPNSNKMNK